MDPAKGRHKGISVLPSGLTVGVGQTVNREAGAFHDGSDQVLQRMGGVGSNWVAEDRRGLHIGRGR